MYKTERKSCAKQTRVRFKSPCPSIWDVGRYRDGDSDEESDGDSDEESDGDSDGRRDSPPDGHRAGRRMAAVVHFDPQPSRGKKSTRMPHACPH